jgi:hypothetical protein
MLIILVSLFGCSNDDLSTPEETFGTIEINMPTEEIGASWHLRTREPSSPGEPYPGPER